MTRSEETLTDAERQTAKEQLVDQACQSFDNPETREIIESARRNREQLYRSHQFQYSDLFRLRVTKLRIMLNR